MYDQNGNKTSIQAGDMLIYHRTSKLFSINREGVVPLNLKKHDVKLDLSYIRNDQDFVAFCVTLCTLFGLQPTSLEKTESRYIVGVSK